MPEPTTKTKRPGTALLALPVLIAILCVLAAPVPGASASDPAGLGGATRLGALAETPGGDILAAGTTGGCAGKATAGCPPPAILLALAGGDGARRQGFGAGGIATTSIPGAAEVRIDAAAVEPDGDILVAGSVLPAGEGGTRSALLVRFLPTGSPDPSFGTAGIVTYAPGPGRFAEATAVAVQDGGGILVAGRTAAQGHNGTFMLARFLADGTLDGGFGEAGLATAFASASGSAAGALALGAGGRILVAGDVDSPGSSSFGVAAYLPDGRPDPTFGEAGVAETATAKGELTATAVRSMRVLPDGDILVAGSAQAGSQACPRVTLARLGADGTPDPRFGKKGSGVATPGWIGGRTCAGIAAQATLPGGASVVAGQEAAGSGLPFLVSRLGADGREGKGTELAAPEGSSFGGDAALLGVGRDMVLGSVVRAPRCYGAGAVAGSPCAAIALFGLLPSGRIDTRFGEAGVALSPPARLCRRATANGRPCRSLLTTRQLASATRRLLPQAASPAPGAILVRLGCPGSVATSCRISAVARRGGRVVAKRGAAVAVARGHSREVRLPLTVPMRSVSTSAGALRLRVSVSADRREAVAERRVRLRGAAPRVR